MVNNLKEKFSILFKFPVWELKADESNHKWAVLCRDPQNFQVYLHVLDYDQQKLVLPEYMLDQKFWWGGITGISGNIVLLHAFHGNQNPDVKKLTAFDFEKKTFVWEAEEFSPVNLSGDYVNGFRIEEGELLFKKIRLSTGEITGLDKNRVQINPEQEKTENNPLKNPFHYSEENSYFKTVQAFLERKFEITAAKAVDYLEFQDVVIISYYLCNDKYLDNYLLVIDSGGNELLHVLINNQLEGFGKGTFFIYQNDLIFFKNKIQLCSYVIHESY